MTKFCNFWSPGTKLRVYQNYQWKKSSTVDSPCCVPYKYSSFSGSWWFAIFAFHCSVEQRKLRETWQRTCKVYYQQESNFDSRFRNFFYVVSAPLVAQTETTRNDLQQSIRRSYKLVGLQGSPGGDRARAGGSRDRPIRCLLRHCRALAKRSLEGADADPSPSHRLDVN